jgi:hypothetical protein
MKPDRRSGRSCQERNHSVDGHKEDKKKQVQLIPAFLQAGGAGHVGPPTTTSAPIASSSCQQYVTKTSENDILLGRGKATIHNIGNQRFRDLVRTRKVEYAACTRTYTKEVIAREILKEVERRGGRFLESVVQGTITEALTSITRTTANPKVWILADSAKVLVKIKQSLRDRDPVPRRSTISIAGMKPGGSSHRAPNDRPAAQASSRVATTRDEPETPAVTSGSRCSTVVTTEPSILYPPLVPGNNDDSTLSLQRQRHQLLQRLQDQQSLMALLLTERQQQMQMEAVPGQGYRRPPLTLPPPVHDYSRSPAEILGAIRGTAGVQLLPYFRYPSELPNPTMQFPVALLPPLFIDNSQSTEALLGSSLTRLQQHGQSYPCPVLPTNSVLQQLALQRMLGNDHQRTDDGNNNIFPPTFGNW